MPIKILTAIDTLGMGGAEQLLLTLLPAINALGHRVEIVALSDWSPNLGPDFAASGVTTHFLHARGRFAFAQSIMGLRRLLAAGRYDLLWTHSRQSSMAGAIALAGRTLPHVATLHSVGYVQAGPLPLRARVTTTLEGRLLARCTKVAVSNAVVRDYGGFFGWPDIAVISNCFDPSTLPPPLADDEKREIRAQLDVRPDEFFLIVPARFVHVKGYPVLIEALKLLRENRGWSPLALAFGQGPIKDEIAAAATEAGVRLRLHESAPQRDLFRFIRAADAVVLPSLRESFGLAALEAMALGAPLVVSNADGLKEITEGRDCALVVPAGDPDALAGAIWDVYQNRADAAARVSRGLAVSRLYELGPIASEWSALFMRCIEECGRAERRA
ncbi:MAG: glycosyltransferase family 4 protein [Rhodoblastus sp.]